MLSYQINIQFGSMSIYQINIYWLEDCIWLFSKEEIIAYMYISDHDWHGLKKLKVNER